MDVLETLKMFQAAVVVSLDLENVFDMCRLNTEINYKTDFSCLLFLELKRRQMLQEEAYYRLYG